MKSSLPSGLLLALLGAFLISRTITRDSTGRTLIDRLLGKQALPPGDDPSVPQAGTPAAAAAANARPYLNTQPLTAAQAQKAAAAVNAAKAANPATASSYPYGAIADLTKR